jgi:hypothetical protein
VRLELVPVMLKRSRRIHGLHPGLAVACLGLLVTGCAGGGRILNPSDPRTVDAYATRELQIGRRSSGDRITVWLRDSTSVTGKYRGLGRMTPEEYRSHFESMLAAGNDSTPWPIPGNDVLVYFKNRKTQTYRLEGFGRHCLEVRGKDSRDVLALDFDFFEAVSDLKVTLWPNTLLADLAAQGKLPSSAQLQLDMRDNRRTIPLDQVVGIETSTPTFHWLLGTLLTMATAAVIVAAAYITTTKGP